MRWPFIGFVLIACSSEPAATDDAAAQLCVDKINEYRKSIGLPAYTRWKDGESCASQEAKSDSETRQPHGAFNDGQPCKELAQNECPGWPGPASSMIPQCLEMMWAEGPGTDFKTHGHYINMSSTQYSKVACGFHTLGDGNVWAVQNFR